MKRTLFAQIIVLSMTLASVGAMAAKVTLTAGTFVGSWQTSSGTENVSVTFEPSGKVLISRSSFTQNSPTQILEEPTVVKDSRPMDGPLVLQIGEAELSVGSGDTMDGYVSYGLKIGNHSAELKPVVRLWVN